MDENSISNQEQVVPPLTKGKTNRALSLGILLLTLSLVAVGIYLLVELKRASKSKQQLPEAKEEISSFNDVSTWMTYSEEAFGYSIRYPPSFIPRKVESERYLSFVIFLPPQGVEQSGFAFGVRENQLEEEVKSIKEEVQLDVSAKLIREGEIEILGYSGFKLEYEPEKSEEGELKTIIILNNGKYSYSISSVPDQIDKIVFTLDIFE